MNQGRERYRILLENLPYAFAYHRIVVDSEGQPIDYIFLEVNPAFEEMTGLKRSEVINRRVTEVLDGINNSSFSWIDTYAQVASSGKSISFEQYSDQISKWYEITAYSDQPGYFAVVFRDITEQKFIEQALKERERSYATLLSNLPGIAYRCDFDPEWTMRFISEGCYKLTGYKPEELLENKKITFNQVINPEYREWLWVKWNKVLSKKEMFEEEYTITTATGEVKWVWEQGQGIYDEYGNVTAIEGFITDITESKLAKENLRISEENLAITLQSIGDGVIATDNSGRITRMNLQAENLTGWKLEDVEGKPLNEVFEIISAKTGKPAINPVYTVMQTGTREGMANDTTLIARDGSRRQIADSAAPIFNSEKNIIGVVMVFSDVTEQYRVKKEILTQKAHLEALFKNTKDAIVYFDTERNGFNMNRQFAEMFGYELEEIKGKNIAKVIDPHGKVKDYSSPRVLKGEAVNFESTRYNKAGEAIDVLVRGGPVYVDGIITGGYTIYSDITARKQAEHKLKYMGLHDKLTDLYNRTYFEEQLDKLERTREYPITFISIDVDGLKLVNDTLGHHIGDELLLICSKILRASLRDTDILARVGGDEFTAILLNTDEATGEKVVKEIQKKTVRYNSNHPEIPISISVGLATVIDEKMTIKEAYKSADDSMYNSKLHKGASAKSHIISALMTTLGERDYITEGHGRRLSNLSLKIGKLKGLSSSQLDNLTLLAQVHDLGKVGIPDKILFKKGPLNDKEWEVMRQHSEKGYRIAVSSPDLSGIAHLILKHHERWDGKGYPLGISGTEIPVECRILSIVDAYDAMTNDRPYCQAKGEEEALAEVQRCSGTQFDPELVDIFISILKDVI